MKKLLKKIIIFIIGSIGPHRWPWLQPKLTVISYHRILPAGHPDNKIMQPGMVVSLNTFKMHLNVLSKYYEFITLNDWGIAEKKNSWGSKNKCAITFDDGWVDNYQYAYPILKEKGIPAMMYLVSSKLDGASVFWPERLSRILLLDDGVNNDLIQASEWFLNAGAVLSHQPDLNEIDSVIEKLKIYSDSEINVFLDGIELKNPSENNYVDLVNKRQVELMLSDGLMSFGCHTKSHARLDKIDTDEDLKTEIISSKIQLEKNLGISIKSFCYPNGRYTDKVVKIVKQRYKNACTTHRGHNNINDVDMHLMRRFMLHEGNSGTEKSLLAKLSGWI